MIIKFSSKVTWVGNLNNELRHFYDDQITTKFGSTYNPYFIQSEKNVLVDTIYSSFANSIQ